MFSSIRGISNDDSDSDDFAGFDPYKRREPEVDSEDEIEEENESSSESSSDCESTTLRRIYQSSNVTVKQRISSMEVTSFCFFPPNFAVCGTVGDNVILFDIRKGSNEARIENHDVDERIRHVILWDFQTYLSCGDDSKVYAFCVRTRSITREFGFYGNVVRLLKLDDSLFCAITDLNDISIVSFKHSKVIKKIKVKVPPVSIRPTSRLLLPKSKHNKRNSKYFVITSCWSFNYALLLNYRRSEDYNIRKIFEFPDTGNRGPKIRAIDSFLKDSYERAVFDEILVASSSDGNMYFYNMWESSLEKEIKIQNIVVKSVAAYRVVKVKQSVNCFMIISNKYVFCGGDMGLFFYFNILEDIGVDGSLSEDVKYHGIYNHKIDEIHLYFKQAEKIEVLMCSGDVTLTSITGLDLLLTKEMEIYMKNDLIDRFCYLVEYCSDEDFYEEEEEEKIGLTKVQLFNKHVHIFKSLMC